MMVSRVFRSMIALGGLLAGIAHAGPLDARIDHLIARADLGNATVSVHALDVRTGMEIASHNADEAKIPASNMKILTSGVALAVLGPGFVFRTELCLDESVTPPRLIIVGSGDPALGDPVLLEREEVGLSVPALMDQLAVALKSQGVVSLSEVVLDDRAFDREFVHPSWPAEQLNRWYCAEVSGLNFHRNVVLVRAEPSKQGASPRASITPDAPWIELANHARTDPDGINTAWVSRPEPSDSMTLMGKVRTPTETEVAVHNPALFAGRVIANELHTRGIGFPDKWAYDHARLADDAERFDDTRAIAVITTPLSDVLQRVNTDSHNLYAECLLKRVGNAVTGEPGSWANGCAVVRMTLSDALGAESAQSTVVADGSGMSRENRVRASTLTAWMRWLAQDSDRWAMFVASLAQPGFGTLQHRFDEGDLASDIHAKSGYLTGVYTLSGVLTDPETGRQVAFSILINDVPPGRLAANAKPLHEQIVAELDAWLVPTSRPEHLNLGG